MLHGLASRTAGRGREGYITSGGRLKRLLRAGNLSTVPGQEGSRSHVQDLDFGNFWYAYSTIAQTLAGSFGFLVAVALYQMQGIAGNFRGRMEFLFANLFTAPERPKELVEALLRDDAERFVAIAQTLAHDPQFEDRYITLSLDVRRLRKIKDRLRLSILLTGPTIVACFGLMPFTNKAVMPATVACALLGMTTLAAIAGIFTYLELVKEITR
jgi:hypothetical protein